MNNNLLTIDMITREAIELFKNSNPFLMAQIPSQWPDMFAPTVKRVMPIVSLPVAVAMGAAAVVIKNPVVSRRNLFGRVA